MRLFVAFLFACDRAVVCMPKDPAKARTQKAREARHKRVDAEESTEVSV